MPCVTWTPCQPETIVPSVNHAACPLSIAHESAERAASPTAVSERRDRVVCRAARPDTLDAVIDKLVEAGATETIFTNPRDTRTQDYITGRFG